jgi:signal transduction histidine kinase
VVNGKGDAEGGRTIQTRVIVLVGTGMLAALAIMGGASWVRSMAFGRQIVAEREALAHSVATQVERILSLDLQVLQGVASAPNIDPADADQSSARAALAQAYLRTQLTSALFLLAPDGRMVAREPGGMRTPDGAAIVVPGVEEVTRTGRPTLSGLVAAERGGQHLFALLPVRAWTGGIAGIVGAELDPASHRFALLLQPVTRLEDGSIDLVDGSGLVIASTDPTRLSFDTGNGHLVQALIKERRSTCEQRDQAPQPGGGTGSELAAFAPVTVAPWVISVRQATARAFAPALALRRDILLLWPILAALALLFAWGAARSVRKPLAVLTTAAERIAEGRIAEPIPPLPEDEVGRLGRSLERMRAALKQSIEDVERANRDLERRVDERTRELQGLYARLREREEWRGELLRKVISAQEDERKRLARELHDETSQTLSALAMGLETALARFPSDLSRQRLEEAKALTVRTLEELHRLIYDLRPTVLDDLGLLSAIPWYAERQLEPRGVTVRFELSGDERRLAPEVETALFRVVQEAVNNIARHGHAETVLIQCALRETEITIEIEDDGEGFDPAELPAPGSSARGLGLMGMRERVELLGGRIEIDASPGQGVRVAVSVPIEPEASHV